MAVIGVSDGRLCGIHLASRAVRWTVATGGGVYLSTPAIDDTTVYFAPGNYDSYVYAIGLKSGTILWKSNGITGDVLKKTGTPSTISPKQFRELLMLSPADRSGALSYYAQHDIFVPLLGDKQSALSKKTTAPSDTVFLYGETKTSSVAVDNQSVYVIQKKLGHPKPLFTLLALDKRTGKEKWRFSEMRSCVKLGYASSPAVTKSMVFFGWGEGKAYGLSAQTGEKLWEDSLHGDIISSPSIAANKLYFATMDGYIYCYNLTGTMPGENFQKSTYCYPNPARGGESNIQVYVTRPGRMDLVIYNAAERPVYRTSANLPAMLPNDEKFRYRWNLKNVANGVYFARIVVKYNDGGTDKKVLKIAVLK
jgi:outer membrane protein assembly factor BamB